MKKWISLLLATACIFTVSACKKQENKPPVSLEEIEKIYETDPNAAAWTMVEAMSLDEKIYQLFIVSPETLSGGEAVTEVNDAVREGFARYPVGGVALSGFNIKEHDQVVKLTEGLQSASSIPLFTAMFAEGGGAGLASIENMGITAQPAKRELTDGQQAYDTAKLLGEELTALGLNLEFAPVADTAEEAEGETDERFYSADPTVVGTMAENTVRGLRDGGVATVLSHFPGQGGAERDEKDGKIRSERTYEELQEKELIPFVGSIGAGVDLVMVSHMINQSITKTDMECTMSTNVMTNILRNTMGFPNVIITDTLNSHGITGYYSAGAAALTAFEAGADMLLLPENVEEAAAAIKGAVSSGRISEMRINESVSRILKVKLERGII